MTFIRTHIPQRHFANRYAATAPKTHRIAANVIELKEQFELQFFLAGFSRENIQIKLERNELVIQAKREKPQFEGEWIHNEVQYGNFERRFELAETLNTAEIGAKFENGVLTVSIPKQAETQPKTIEIN